MATRHFHEYLVYGFTRNVEAQHELFMNVDHGIYKMIHEFYPKLLRFKDYDIEKFQVTDNGTIIKALSYECYSATVYAESFGDEGFNKGVQYWSVKNIKDTGRKEFTADTMGDGYCFHSIGVRSEKGSLIKTGSWWTNEECESQSFFKGHCPKWGLNEIITVKLDCNQWTVTYYNKEGNQLQHDSIEKDLSYYFCIQLCKGMTYTHFEIVETPFHNIPA